MRNRVRFLSCLFLIAMVLSMLGTPSDIGKALSTTVDDTATIAIPDASCGAPIARTINVGSSFIIADLDVGINLSHDRRSDVRVTLQSPSGTLVVLISGGGLGSPALASPDDYNNYDVLLDDTTVNSLYDNDNDDTGAPLYDRTARPFELLSPFKGEDANGNWTLRICDTRAGITGATVPEQYNSARLVFTSADPNTITGTVFTDYNDNGLRGPADTPVQGVTVTAYDSTGAVVGAPDVTDATGAYSLNIPDGTPVRIEFTTIPGNLRPGAFGRDSGTTVQFVTAPAAGVDMGLANPQEYCQNNPYLVMPCYINGDPLAGGTAGTLDVLVSIPNNAYGRTDLTIEQPLATGAQIGTTWGLAYQRLTNTVFAGALAKRHSGFGPLGEGGIYRIVVDPQTGASTSVSNFLDITTLGIPISGMLSNGARGLPIIANTPNTDPTGWDAVGKGAIGDMDIGTDDDSLWFINLSNQALYRLNDITSGPVTASGPYSIPPQLSGGGSISSNPCPAASDVRPWAVEVYQGNVYVGVVCTAESTQNTANLRGYIIRTSEAAPGVFTLAFEFALNYPRGVVSDADGGYPAEWRPWSPTMTSLCRGSVADPCNAVTDLAFDKQIIYPQPILSDIEFDIDGDLIIGLMDRTGHQTGNANFATSSPWGTVTLYDKDNNYAPVVVNIPANPGSLYEGAVAGDVLRACLTGGVFILENNATCGAVTTTGDFLAPGPAQGPGNGEYYWQDMYPVQTNQNGGTHHEVLLGGLVLFPGTDEVAVSMFDPFAILSGGVAWFSNATGARTRAYEVFGTNSGGAPTTFGKAAGIGDIEGFCYSAPIEIGNRVWNDVNGNGIQEPGEAPLANVIVQLLDSGGTVIATVTTDANGSYFFSSGPGTDSGNQDYLIPGLLPNTNYTIQIPDISGGSQQASLAGLSLSPNDQGGASADQRDSDATVNGVNAVIPVTTGNPGDNNHTFDFGFTTSNLYSLGNRVWLDDGTGGGTANNGLQDGTEVGIGSVLVNLYADTNNDGIPDGGVIASQSTDANGYYRFDNLTAGDYIVEIAASNFTGVAPLAGYASSAVDEAEPDLDGDRNDNGLGVIPDAVNGIRSGTVTLGPGLSEPLNETDLSASGQGAVDGRANMTVDFGFVPGYSLGNRVWFDTNNNGVIDFGTEVGISGVRVELYQDNGDGVFGVGDTFVTFDTTDANGYYRFDNLPAGDYVVVLADDNFRDVGVGDTVPGNPLEGYWSSGTTINASGVPSDSTANDADTTPTDSDENGITTLAGNAINYVAAAAVTLGPGLSEPLNETDLEASGQGAVDGRANMTVDFGFYQVAVGDLVFVDVNSDGDYDVGTDTPLANALVQLYSSNGTEIITGADGIPGTADDGFGPDGIPGNGDDGTGGVLTGASGLYLFSGLPQGDYIVGVTPPVGYSSTVDTANPGDTTSPNDNVDDNDNGVGVAAGQALSNPVTLTPGSLGAQNNNTVNNNNGTTSNPTVDFGFVTPNYSLGNRVWFDTNNNGVIDFGTEVGISGVRVELYQDNGDGVFGVGDTFVTFDTTDANGYYRFDNLPAGDYVVVLADDNFRDVGVGDTVPGNPLEGYWSSGTTINASGVPSDSTANDADTTPTDSDENGITTLAGNAINYVAAAAVTLGPGLSEPLNETDLEASGQGAVDGRANMTVDFGFYQVAVGDLVFVDVNSDGDYDVGTDTPLANALVQLYSSNGTEIITGADGIPGTADDGFGPDGIPGNGDDGTGGVLTGASGLYLFSGLPQGDYIVGVTPPVGYSSTVDTANPGDTTSPNDNVDDNDNGVGVAAGQALSNPVTLTPGSLGAQNNNTVNNNNGTTSNPTVDFGFVNNNVLSKTIFDTSETFTSGTNVAVGEIVTYEILMNLPIGTALNNVTVTDQMEKGLAFVDCLLVEVAGANQTATVCPPAVSAITDPGDSPANPANPGRQVVFSLGNIPAQAAPATLRIRYRAIVLDVNENQQGVILSNNVALAFTGGTLNTSAPDVEIDEPDLVINKTSNPSTGVPIGTPIQFTLTINHSLLSSTDAFDVVVTDILPPELEYIPCSVVYTGLAPNDPAAPAYCPGATSNLVFRWDVFPLGATSTITFNARLVSSPATNTANVAWTSLPIDPQPNGLPVQLSVHNSRSTERWFDPLSSVDVYGAAAVARINASSSATSDVDDVELPEVLPPTGYPPNVFTSITKQPVDLAYRATDVWLEIPKLGLKMPIVGVPLVESEWNLTWLGDEAGWLEGTAFPSWSGNSVLTGHVTLPDGGPGPFVSLGELKWDDRIIIHAYGVSFEYKVRQNRTVSPFNTSVLQHKDEPWITLITCKTYNEATGGYSNRIAVRSIFVRILDGDSSPGEKNVR